MIRTTTRTTDIVLCGMFVALMAVGAFIKIMLPLGLFQVTFSLQFFFALLAGFLLGAERGCMSVIVYLITGLIGIPIFAHGGGIGYLLKPTFGFLIGFAAAAAVCGYVAKKIGASGFWAYLFAAFCGEMVYYLCVRTHLLFLYVQLCGRQRRRHRIGRAHVGVVPIHRHTGFRAVRHGSDGDGEAEGCVRQVIGVAYSHSAMFGK